MLKKLKEYLPEVHKTLMTRGSTPELPLITLPIFNEKIWGIQKQALTVIGARTSNGKTAFANQISIDLAKQGKRVVNLSLEQTVVSVAIRAFSYEEQIDNEHLRKGRFKEYLKP